MKQYIAPLLRLGALVLLLTTIYEQNDTINLKKDQINKLQIQNDSLSKANDSLYSEYWSLKTYTDIKEGRAEE